MQRREFITLLAARLLGRSPRARSNRGVRRIGVLMINPESDPEGEAWVRVFREELQSSVGRKATISGLTFAGRHQATWTRCRRLQGVCQVATQTHPVSRHASTVALLKETRTIPIIFAITADQSERLRRKLPATGGNATGFIVTEPTISGNG